MFFKMRTAYFVAAISSVLTVAAVASAKYAVDAPKIQVHAKGPAGMSIEGVSNTLKVDEDDKTVTFKTFLTRSTPRTASATSTCRTGSKRRSSPPSC